MYPRRAWLEEETIYDDEEAYDDDHFEFEARWRGSGEVELLISHEPAMPLQALPDFTLPVGIAAVLFVIFVLTRGGSGREMVLPVIEAAAAAGIEEQPAPAAAVPAPEAPDPDAFAAPYADYVITQGVHGASYGHMAIDLAAGKGEPVLAPINGTVTAHHTDANGNPTLVIENERYRVTLLHGIYSVSVGDTVRLGDRVGEESNLGYTTDMRGVPCWQKAGYCGYHTHLNVFDKSIGANVNPLELIRP